VTHRNVRPIRVCSVSADCRHGVHIVVFFVTSRGFCVLLHLSQIVFQARW